MELKFSPTTDFQINFEFSQEKLKKKKSNKQTKKTSQKVNQTKSHANFISDAVRIMAAVLGQNLILEFFLIFPSQKYQ